MRKKVVSSAEAVAIIRDGDTLCCSGFGSNGVPVELALALEKRFLETGSPKDLTCCSAGVPAMAPKRESTIWATRAMLKRVIGGHYGLVPKIGKLALENKVEAYNLPLGVISHMYRDIACGLPGTVSKVGLGTFVDPRRKEGRSTPAPPKTWLSRSLWEARNCCSTRPFRFRLHSSGVPPPTRKAISPRSGKHLPRTRWPSPPRPKTAVTLSSSRSSGWLNAVRSTRDESRYPGSWWTALWLGNLTTIPRPSRLPTTLRSPPRCGCRLMPWSRCRSTSAKSLPAARHSS